MCNEKVANWMYINYGLLIGALILSIVIECALICVRKIARTVPYNYILLFLFTVCEAYIVAFICSATDPHIVLAAAAMTAAIVVALTVYAFTTKTDFTVLGGFFFIFGAVMLMLGLFTLIFQWPALNMVYCSLGVILFGLYLVFDT